MITIHKKIDAGGFEGSAVSLKIRDTLLSTLSRKNIGRVIQKLCHLAYIELYLYYFLD